MTVISLPVVVTITSNEPPPTFTVSLPVSASVVPAALFTGAQSVCIGQGTAAIWRVVVIVDGVDKSDQLVGDVMIDASEGAARIAEFSLKLPVGSVVSLSALTGRSVTIDIADFSTGVVRYAMRRFTGVVDTPTLDQASRVIALRCTDDLQGRCDGMTSAQLFALIGGYRSDAVFDPAASGWDYAQDRLSTIPVSLDVSPQGGLRVTPWAPKLTPDISLGAGLVGDGSLRVEVADRAQLVNQVDVEFDYRFPRVKAECYSINFEYVNMTNFAAFILAGGWWLQRSQVTAAIEAAGGTVESISYVPLPTSVIAVGSGYFTPSAADLELCMGFSAAVSFDYAQTTEEQHHITVKNTLSVAAVGLRRETITGALEGVYPDITAAETAIRLYKDKATSIPPTDAATPEAGKVVSSDVSLTTATNRAAADAAMRALIAVAKTRILASHRKNTVSATVPLIPAMDLDKTIEITADGVHAIGKCVRVVDRLSHDEGSAVSEVTIALCSLAGVGVTHAEDPTEASAGTSAGAKNLTVTPTVVFNSAAAADHKLTVTFPGVEEAERARAVVPITKTIAAPLVEDVFTVTI